MGESVGGHLLPSFVKSLHLHVVGNSATAPPPCREKLPKPRIELVLSLWIDLHIVHPHAKASEMTELWAWIRLQCIASCFSAHNIASLYENFGIEVTDRGLWKISCRSICGFLLGRVSW